MLNFFNRLEEYRKTTGLSKRAFEMKAGISNGLIGRAAKRGDGQLSQENIVKILNTYDIDANWLLTGKGSMGKECKLDEKNPSYEKDLEVINYIDFNLNRFQDNERFLRIIQAIKTREFEDRITKEIFSLKKKLESITKSTQ